MDRYLAERVFSCIDNTTLNATDNHASVETFCRHTIEMVNPSVAAVCVYPRFVAIAKDILAGTDIKVASVAGAFPHGQLPIELKVAEVKYAISSGADEIDMVLSRGAMLSGDYDTVYNEVVAMKNACNGRTLKVILETGELSPTLIVKASQIAIDGGADFIKTSTGKIAVGATLEAAELMLNVVKENVKFNKKTIGFKAAGGIKKPDDAFAYAVLAKKIMSDEYINNQTFRIGASSLTESLHSLLTF